jgi:hypothetical protein
MTIREQDKPSKVLGSFRRGNETVVERETPSKADVLGIKPPALSDEQKAGLAVEAAIGADRLEAKLAAHEKYAKEKAEYERQRDDAIWQKVQSRRTASL